jgi:DNA primase
VEPIIMKAIIAGLIRYPDMIAANAEALGSLPIRDRKLDTLRSALITAAFEGPMLEQERVRTILGEAGPGVDLERNLGTNGLAFSFLRGNADSERAKRDLVAVITALASRPELDAALAAVTERLMASPDEAVFAEQRRLRAAREEADRALAALAEGAEV